MPWSTGAGTSSSRSSRRRCGPCRSSPADSPRTPRGGRSATVPPRTFRGSWSIWSTSRCSRWWTRPRAPVSGCWRPCVCSARRVGRRTARPTGWSAASCRGHATSGWRIRAEQDNLVQALRFGLAHADGGIVAATFPVLAGLWIIESSYARLATVAEETARVLSHFRAGPDFVEVTRTALTLCTAFTFLLQGPRAVRSLVALRRLPPAPPNTLARATAIVLGAVPEDRSALQELCDSDEPLVAGAANGIASYLWWESQSDPDGALKSAERMLQAFENRGVPWMWALAHCRIAELCLQVEQGAEAQRHLRAALPVLEKLGVWTDVVGIRWWMVLSSLQIGAVDEAEHWLEQTAPHRADEPVGALTYGLGVRAEILLARGEVEAGLRLWRR